jgi:hypothetical protein
MSLEWARARALENEARLRELLRARNLQGRIALAEIVSASKMSRTEAANAERFTPERKARRAGPTQWTPAGALRTRLQMRRARAPRFDSS